MRKPFIVWIILAVSFLGGCAASDYADYCRDPFDIIGYNHMAGDKLIQMADAQLTGGKIIITSSFVNLDKLSDTSSFGRLAANQVATRFTEHGHKVIELLLRQNIAVEKERGEFLLSREFGQLSSEINAQAALVGTYAVAEKFIYVTAKLIDVITCKSMASFDYKIPINQDMESLIAR